MIGENDILEAEERLAEPEERAEELEVTNEEAIDDDTAAEAEPEEVDYESLIREDIALLKASFPELSALGDITELDNPLRYAALRDLGLSPAEAYLATQRRRRTDTRAHLFGAVPRGTSSPKGSMSQKELEGARELFSGMTDIEIQRLYRKVMA